MWERYAEVLSKHHEGQIYSPGAPRRAGLACEPCYLDVVQTAPARPNEPAAHYPSRRKNKCGPRAAGVI